MGMWIHWHNKNVKSHYTIKGTKNAYGIVMTETSLKHLMANCMDFEEEETLLLSKGWKMGVAIDCTPKCNWVFLGVG